MKNNIKYDNRCFLTSACIRHLKKDFSDSCDELMTLRWFRDNFVTKEDINYYYEVAPKIIKKIDESNDQDKIYEYIYNTVVEPCVKDIKKGRYHTAYERYKNSVLILEETYVNNKTKKLTKNKNPQI